MEIISCALDAVKYYFSQSKNALFHFCEFQKIRLSTDVLERIGELENATKKKYRKLEIIDYPKIDKIIKRISNKKLRLTFQTILATGLRVSEVADISQSDCVADNNIIALSFLAKGGDIQTVTIKNTEYPKLFDDVMELIENTGKGKKVFYSAVYLSGKAKQLGFKCHDLRRIFAHVEYKKTRSKTAVQEKLRHTNIKNTTRYLRCKMKF